MVSAGLCRPSRLDHRGVPVPAHPSSGVGLGEYVHLPFTSEHRSVCFAISVRTESLLGPAREATIRAAQRQRVTVGDAQHAGVVGVDVHGIAAGAGQRVGLGVHHRVTVRRELKDQQAARLQ